MLSEHIAKVLFRASKSKEEVHSDVGRVCRAASQSLTKPPQGEECLTEANLYDSLYPNECHKVGTDALVCPPIYPYMASR